MQLLLPLMLLFIGEGVFIWAEMVIAHTLKSPQPTDQSTIAKMVAIAVIAGLVIIGGYYFGYKAHKNIWLVTATSIGAILVTEPIISWLIFYEKPTLGASIGLIFGVLGILSTTFL